MATTRVGLSHGEERVRRANPLLILEIPLPSLAQSVNNIKICSIRIQVFVNYDCGSLGVIGVSRLETIAGLALRQWWSQRQIQ